MPVAAEKKPDVGGLSDGAERDIAPDVSQVKD
jgi:hypothetical protein